MDTKDNVEKIENGFEGLPWLNADGTRKSDEEIKRLGRNWSTETWDSYLQEDIGILKYDALRFFADMDTDFVLERAGVVDVLKRYGGHEHLKFSVAVAFEELTPMERDVLRCFFWGQMDDRSIAESMGKTYGHIRVCKSRAIKKLGEIFPSKRFKAKVRQLRNNGVSVYPVSTEKQEFAAEYPEVS